MFENIPQAVLMLLIKVELVRCDILKSDEYKNTFNISLASTLVSLLVTIADTYMDARYLEESLSLYFMNKMSANTAWYPYKQFIQSHSLDFSINFGDVQIEYPLLTHTVGY